MSINAIKIWKSIIETSNPNSLDNIIHEDALFYSPVVYLPQHGKKNVRKYLYSAVKAFKGKQFKYNDNIFSQGLHFFAEFNACFSEIEVNGVDIIKLEKGLIKEFRKSCTNRKNIRLKAQI